MFLYPFSGPFSYTSRRFDPFCRLKHAVTACSMERFRTTPVRQLCTVRMEPWSQQGIILSVHAPAQVHETADSITNRGVHLRYCLTYDEVDQIVTPVILHDLPPVTLCDTHRLVVGQRQPPWRHCGGSRSPWGWRSRDPAQSGNFGTWVSCLRVWTDSGKRNRYRPGIREAPNEGGQAPHCRGPNQTGPRDPVRRDNPSYRGAWRRGGPGAC